MVKRERKTERERKRAHSDEGKPIYIIHVCVYLLAWSLFSKYKKTLILFTSQKNNTDWCQTGIWT